MSNIKPEKTNYAAPGKPLTKREFKQMVSEAETGKFYSIDEVKSELEKWKKKHLSGL